MVVGWLACSASAAAIIYGVYPYTKDVVSMSSELAGFYQGASRPAWGFVMAWIVIACSSGYGGAAPVLLHFFPSLFATDKCMQCSI